MDLRLTLDISMHRTSSQVTAEDETTGQRRSPGRDAQRSRHSRWKVGVDLAVTAAAMQTVTRRSQ